MTEKMVATRQSLNIEIFPQIWMNECNSLQLKKIFQTLVFFSFAMFLLCDFVRKNKSHSSAENVIIF